MDNGHEDIKQYQIDYILIKQRFNGSVKDVKILSKVTLNILGYLWNYTALLNWFIHNHLCAFTTEIVLAMNS